MQVKSIAMFLTKLAYISWRRDLVIHLQGLYLKHNSYFFLNCVDKTVDNPYVVLHTQLEFCALLSGGDSKFLWLVSC